MYGEEKSSGFHLTQIFLENGYQHGTSVVFETRTLSILFNNVFILHALLHRESSKKTQELVIMTTTTCIQTGAQITEKQSTYQSGSVVQASDQHNQSYMCRQRCHKVHHTYSDIGDDSWHQIDPEHTLHIHTHIPHLTCQDTVNVNAWLQITTYTPAPRMFQWPFPGEPRLASAPRFPSTISSGREPSETNGVLVNQPTVTKHD